MLITLGMIALCYKDICLGHRQEVKSLQSSECQHNDFAKILRIVASTLRLYYVVWQIS